MSLSLTCTFLFTDIEGSTKLWEAHPSAMQVALARHDSLLREAIERNNGIVFKTIGDAFCAVFESPIEAVEAAVQAQQSLTNEAWPSPVQIRVRMAVHTGVAEQRNDDYFGPPLNRVARLLSIGHGGQTLLSLAAYELSRDQLPQGLSLTDVGEHRLKDLIRPEHVFQLNAANLPTRFAALRSLNSFPNNLPQQLTSFLGREKELGEVSTLLAYSRLVTLTGSGGCGKSRLALQLGADLLERFPDGVWFVELAALTDPALLPQTVAGAIGISELVGEATGALCRALQDRHLLLILDNCEHLIDACARLANALLRACPQVTILATSRAPLSIAGESLSRIPSLSLPERHPPPPADKLSQFGAVRLFVERAQAVRADFAVTNANAPAVAEICWVLDGIPLAIELAAARLRSMGIEDLLARLEKNPAIIGSRDTTAPSRQRTLRALIDWSYDLLSENEQLLLARLSVFAGGWTLEAAEGICAGSVFPPAPESATPNHGGLGGGRDSAGSPLLGRGGNIEEWEVLDLLSSLVDKSLALLDQGRYKMLETIKQYAQEKAAPETDLLRERHMQWFTDWVRAGFEDILYRGIHTRAYQQFAEVDNIRQALRQAHQADESETVLVLAGLSRFIWYADGRNAEGIAEMHAALEKVEGEPDSLLTGFVMASLAQNYRMANQFVPSYAWGLKALAIHRALGEKLAIADALNNLGALNELNLNDRSFLMKSRDWLQEAAQLQREGGNRLFASSSQQNLGQWHVFNNELEAAEQHYEEAKRDILALQDWTNEGPIEDCLAELRYRQGRLAESDASYQKALQLNYQNRNFREVGLQLVSMGRNAGAHGQWERAARLLGAAETHHRRYFLDYLPVSRTDADATLAAAREALGPAVLEAALQAGRALGTADAVAFALQEEAP